MKSHTHTQNQGKPQMDFSCHQIEFPVLGMCYIQLSLWPNRFDGNHPKTQSVAKSIGCSPQTDSMNL